MKNQILLSDLFTQKLMILCLWISFLNVILGQNVLCLNNEKTGIMLIGSPHQLRKAGTISLVVDDSIMESRTK